MSTGTAKGDQSPAFHSAQFRKKKTMKKPPSLYIIFILIFVIPATYFDTYANKREKRTIDL